MNFSCGTIFNSIRPGKPSRASKPVEINAVIARFKVEIGNRYQDICESIMRMDEDSG